MHRRNFVRAVLGTAAAVVSGVKLTGLISRPVMIGGTVSGRWAATANITKDIEAMICSGLQDAMPPHHRNCKCVVVVKERFQQFVVPIGSNRRRV